MLLCADPLLHRLTPVRCFPALIVAGIFPLVRKDQIVKIPISDLVSNIPIDSGGTRRSARAAI